MKILWLAPNFNHYKARFLNVLANYPEVDLTVLAGKGISKLGHKDLEFEWNYKVIKTFIPKSKFGYSIKVFKMVLSEYKKYDWVMIPREKKNIPLIFLVLILRHFIYRKKKTKIFSYNHPFFGKYKPGFNAMILKFIYAAYDKIIFYTEESCEKVLNLSLIKKEKANWANNTLNTIAITENYSFDYPKNHPIYILFISRLIKSKGINTLFEYFGELENTFTSKNLVLEIIGDGPLNYIVKKNLKPNIIWHGALNDEKIIGEAMSRASIVFLPGKSGLTINHALIYGRPYITFSNLGHGPEFSYLIDNRNGLILSGNKEENLSRIVNLLNDKDKLYSFCSNSFEDGKKLSINNWCERVISALT